MIKFIIPAIAIFLLVLFWDKINETIYKKFNINPSDRPQNLNVDKYLKIVNEYENLIG